MKQFFSKYAHRLADAVVSKSMAVFVVGTWMRVHSLISEQTWLLTAAAYLGYNLLKIMPGMPLFTKKQEPKEEKS